MNQTKPKSRALGFRFSPSHTIDSIKQDRGVGDGGGRWRRGPATAQVAEFQQGLQRVKQTRGKLRGMGSRARGAGGPAVLGGGVWGHRRRRRVRWWLSVVGRCLAMGQRDRDRGRRTVTRLVAGVGSSREGRRRPTAMDLWG